MCGQEGVDFGSYHASGGTTVESACGRRQLANEREF